jgi:putative membrane protein
VADIPIRRKEGRNIWPLLLGLLVLLAILWYVFGRRNNNTAAAPADTTAVASSARTTDSAGGATGNNMAGAGAAGAAGAASTTGASGSTTALGDADIANVIHEVNAGEIAAGKIAETKASNSDVKSYARDMVREHTALDKKGAKVASPAGATNAMRDSIVNANNAMSSQLQSAANGAAFDRAYIDGQVMGHQNALAFLQRAQNMAQDSQLKQIITSAIPDVEKHLARARTLQSKVGQ